MSRGDGARKALAKVGGEPQGLTLGLDAELFDRSVARLVSRLRQRLRDDARESRCIKTVRSEGDVFAQAAEPGD